MFAFKRKTPAARNTRNPSEKRWEIMDGIAYAQANRLPALREACEDEYFFRARVKCLNGGLFCGRAANAVKYSLTNVNNIVYYVKK